MKRAYSILTVKSVDEDQRIITGTATTPEPDRMGDIVEPLGVKYKNPLPLLWQHQSQKPVGTVRFDKPTKDGITFTAKIAQIAEPGNLKDRLDEAWQSVKLGLVRAVSIGFRELEYAWMDGGGIRFIESEVLELSLVTIPANADATITSVKSIDTLIRAVSGIKDDVRPTPPVSGNNRTKSISTKAIPAKETKMKKKTTAELIAGFTATRQDKVNRMAEIMDSANDAGNTLSAEEKNEYDELEVDIKELDEHIARLGKHEQVLVRRAANVTGADPDESSNERDPNSQTRQVRQGDRIHVNPRKLPPGTAFTRYALSLMRAQGNLMQAEQIFKSNPQWMSETPEVAEILKTAVNAGTTTDTTWAGPLVNYQIMVQEFIDYLRPLTIIGRIAGLRRVPFKIKIPRQTGAATVNWVGEGKVKPLTSMAFDTITMDFAKIAGIIPLTEELVRLSSPSAEALVREELAKAIIQFMDSQFVDPTKAANDVSPASITNGVTPTAATGATAAAFRLDFGTMLKTFIAANMNAAGLTILMTQSQALSLSLMTNSLGQPVWPNITLDGGTIGGLQVITSENIPAMGSSPTDGGMIIALKASDILLADDGVVTLDASREASLQMDTAPDSPATASTVMVSLWQNNMVAIKAERWINWAKARSTSVAYISYAKYAE